MTISESLKEIQKPSSVLKRNSASEIGEHRRNTSKIGIKSDLLFKTTLTATGSNQHLMKIAQKYGPNKKN